jgi:hypothetical protein
MRKLGCWEQEALDTMDLARKLRHEAAVEAHHVQLIEKAYFMVGADSDIGPFSS